MALITKDQLATLDYIYDGQPFVEVTGNGSADTSLDLIYNGQPFVVVATSGGGAVIKEGAAAITATASLTAEQQILRGFDCSIASTATLSADAELIPGGVTVEASGSWSAAASVSATVNKIIQLGTPGTRTPQTITAYGDAASSTLQKKFGTGSIAFDQVGDYLKTASNVDFQFGTGDFTIETWVYRNNLTSNQYIYDLRTATATTLPLLYFAAGSLVYYANGANRVITTVNTLNTWIHVAVSRSGTDTRVFVNGTQVGSTWVDSTNMAQGAITIGASYVATSPYAGYMDEFRVSKGLARYTSNFTAPTAPFTNDSNTVLLIHADGNIVDDTGFSPEALSSNFAVTATAGVIRGGAATMSVTASVTATISHIGGADLFAFTEAALAAQVDRIRDNNVSVSSQFDLAADGVRGIYISAQADSQFDIAVANLRVRFDEAAVEAAFSLTADAEVIAGGEVVEATGNWSSEFASDAIVNKQVDATSSNSAEFQQSTSIERIAGFESQLQAEITTTASADKTAQAELAASAAVDLIAIISHIHGADLTAFTDAALITDADVIRSLDAAISSQFSSTVDNLRIRNQEVSSSSEFALEITIGNTQTVSADISCQASLTATISHIEGADLQAFADSQLLANTDRIRDFDSTTNAEFTASATASVTIPSSTEITASAEFTVLEQRLRNVIADITTESQLEATIGNTKVLAADLEVFADLAAAAVKTVPLASDQQVVADVAADTSVTKEYASDANAEFVITATISHIEGADLFAFTQASLTTDADVIRNLDSLMTSTSMLVADIGNVKSADSSVSSTTDITASVGKIVQIASTTTAVFNTKTNATKITGGYGPNAGPEVLDAVFYLDATANEISGLSADIPVEAVMSVSVGKLQLISAGIQCNSSLTANGFITNRRPRQASLTRTTSISTVQSVLGGASLYAPSGAYATYYSSGDYLIKENKDWQLEFFFYPTSVASANIERLIAAYSGTTELWSIAYGNRFVRFSYLPQAGSIETLDSSAQWFQVNQWHYLRVVKTNTGIQLQGAVRSTGGVWSSISTLATTGSTNLYNPATYTTARLDIGDINTGVPGYFDEVFLSNNSTRQQFAVGTTPNKITAGIEDTTIALFHYDVDYSDDITGVFKASANLVSETALDITGVKAAEASAQISSASNLTVSLDVTREASADLPVEGFVTVINGRIRPGIEFAESQFDLACDINATKTLTSDISSTASATVDATKIFGPIEIDASSDTQLAVIADVSKEMSANLSVEGFVLAANGRIRSDVADLDVTTDMSVVGQATLAGFVDATAETQFMAVPSRTLETTAAIAATTTMSVTASADLDAISIQWVIGDLTSTVDVTKDIRSNLQVTATADIYTTQVSRASASLQVNGFVLATGRIINLEDSATWIVPADNNTYMVKPEIREYRPAFEQRTYSIEEL